MELVVIGNTTDVDDKKLRNVSAPDGTIYMERRLTLSFEFVGGLFTKIEQNEEYTGNTSTDQLFFEFTKKLGWAFRQILYWQYHIFFLMLKL